MMNASLKKPEDTSMSTYTESQKKAIIKYISEKTDDIRLRLPKGTKDKWRTAAEKEGKSMTQFVADIINDHIDNGTP